MSNGFSTRPIDTLLTERALDFLAAGPSDVVPLIEHICQLPGAPRVVAEQMALALFGDHPGFARDAAGRWCLASALASAEAPGSVPLPELRAHGAAEGASGVSGVTVGARCSAPPVAVSPDELARLSYVVVDVETTGTRPWAGDRVTEVAAIVVRDGQVAEQFQTLVNPERPIPPMITALTHISWDMVKDAPRFRDVCDELLRVMEGHVFVAHNAEFDWRFLSAEVQRATGRQLMGRRLCTVRLARRVLPHLRSRRLDSVADYYNVEIAARHRAAGDAVATAHILLRLLDEAREHDCRSWDALQQFLGTRQTTRRPRRAPAMPRSIDKDTTA